jgi:uncharacterized protein (TIGR00730 family)
VTSGSNITGKIVTVFGSSRPCEGEPDYEEARELGRALASADLAVCSGGYSGVMTAVSQGAKERGGKTYGVTSERFAESKVNAWIDIEIRVHTWQERLFELIRLGNAYVVCKGGTGTLVELGVVWEMLNKSVMQPKPFAVLGNFWHPVIEHVREVELAHSTPWGEAGGRLIHHAASPVEVASYLASKLK